MRQRSAASIATALLVWLSIAPVAGAAPIGGVWASEGYGYVFDLRADTLEAFEVTSVSCVPAFRATASAVPNGALGAFTVIGRPRTLFVLPDSGQGRSRIHMNGAASDILLRRIEKKPAACDRPPVNTPQSNFDVFAQTWTEHYPFFVEKKTDWNAVVAANRSKVSATTTPEELYAVLVGMITPLEDAHSFLDASDIKREYHGSRTSPSSIERDQADKAYALVNPYLRGPLHQFCEGKLEFGMLSSDIAYFRLRGFYGYTQDRSFEGGLTALEAALDTIFSGAKKWKGLVIDVRINGGGADPYGLAIASRLTKSPYVAYEKQARSDPTDATKWTPPQVSMVKPSTRPGLTGPVVELIGVQSISAAETFTQALLKRSPHVTRVGENTQGVFSDVLGRTLPNGWRFGLPNERFVTDGKTYDGPGIAPDVAVESFTPQGLASGKDAGVERAVAILNGEKGGSRD
jgi:hypothetical protein